MTELINTDYELPCTDLGEGFSYLYDLLSHLTSSKHLFVHKINILLQLSSEINKSIFTRADIEALFPQYSSKALGSILSSLFDSGWLVKEEGTISYSLSKAGLLFMRFLPFLYKGDDIDESAFQIALEQIFEVAETMDIDLKSREILRDQAIHALQRSIEEIKSALISKNPERIYVTAKKMNIFLKVIDNFIKRLKELNKKKRELDIPFTNADKTSISILLSTKMKILELLEVRKKYLAEASLLGDNVFSKHDVDRFLYNQDFKYLSEIFQNNQIGFVPSNSKWIDENDIISALYIFFTFKKNIRERNISPKIDMFNLEPYEKGDDPYITKVEEDLVEELSESDTVDLGDFLLQQKSKTDIFMYLASICYLDGQYIFSSNNKKSLSFKLEIYNEGKSYNNKIIKTLSKGRILRRDIK